MPNPTYRSSTTAATGPGGTIVGYLPAGTVDGDALYAALLTSGNRGSGINLVPPGWTLLDTIVASSGQGQLNVYWKIAASEPASWVWALGDDLAESGVAQVVAVKNPGAGSPTDGHAGQSNAASTSVVAPSVTPTVANGLLIGFFGVRAVTSFTPDASMTEAQDQSCPTTTLETAYQALAGVAATGTRTATAGVSAVTFGWHGVVPGQPLVPTYRSSSSVAATSPSNNIYGSPPVGTQDGDALYACVWHGSASTTPTITAVPAGWTLLDTTTVAGSRMSIYWKIALGEPASTAYYAWTASASSAAWAVQIVAVQSPGNAGAPTDVSGILGNASSVNIAAPSITPGAANGLLLGFFGTRAGATFTPASGMSEAQDAQTTNNTPNHSLETAWQVLGTPAATGTRTAVATLAATNIGWLGVVMGPVSGLSLWVVEADDTLTAAATSARAAAASVTEDADSLLAVLMYGVPRGAFQPTAFQFTGFQEDAVTTGAGDANITEFGDTLAPAALANAIAAGAANVELDDSVAGAATAAVALAASIAEQGDTLAAVLYAAEGADAALTELGDTLTGALAGAIAGTGANTEANDSASAAATVAIAAAATINEADDSSVAVAVEPIVGVGVMTEVGDVLTATASLAVAAASNPTEGNDAGSGSATMALVGNTAISEADDTLTANIPLVGGLHTDVTELADTLAAALLDAIAADAVLLEADDTASGATTTAALVADATIAEADDTMAGDISTPVGAGLDAVILEADDTLAAVATLAIVADLTAQEEGDTLTGTLSGAAPIAPIEDFGPGPRGPWEVYREELRRIEWEAIELEDEDIALALTLMVAELEFTR